MTQHQLSEPPVDSSVWRQNNNPVDIPTPMEESSDDPVTNGPDGDMQRESPIVYDVSNETEMVLKVSGVSKIKDKDQFLSQQPTMLRGLPWKILAMPRIVQMEKQRTLGFFLQCNADNDSPQWSCTARAELSLLAQKEGCVDLVKKIGHTFHCKENDWGFASFITWSELLNADKGYVKDDSIILKVKVNAEAPHGMAWDSKKHTGYVGLRNQGATCYMNSLLQTLFCTNKLRKAVYLMPTDNDDSQRSVALALQRVFYELQFTDQAVATKKLTRSFGWETLDSFMQHDVQELCRVLVDNMEDKMKGTCVEGCIPQLFCGKMLSYIKCTDVDYKSERMENFYDIQLNVKGVSNIYDSFKDYVNVEILEGENKYDAGEYGLQRAEKGVHFVKFPPILHLQLLRFQYDPHTDQNVKINDRFEFPEQLDLDQYLRTPEDTPARYFLHAVLVHTGDNYGGHYVVYINPKGDGRWCKFDDDVVSTVSASDAIQQNYGGMDEELAMKSCTSAYMLVYIRESAKADVLAPVLAEDIPTTLVERLTEEKNLELQRRKEKSEAHLYSDILVFLDEDFYGWQGHDLYDPDCLPNRLYKFKKTCKMREVLIKLGEYLGKKNDLRAWQLTPRNNINGAVRVMYIDMVEWADKELNDLASNGSMPSPNVSLWITDDFPFDKEKDLLIFLKFYSPLPNPYLTFCGHLTVTLDCKLSTILAKAREKVNLPENTPLLVFEEKKATVLDDIDQSGSPTIDRLVEMLMDGNILVFQENNPSFSKARLGHVKEFYKHFYQRLEVVFSDKDSDETFTLTLSQSTTYLPLSEAVGKYLNLSADHIQFFKVAGESPGHAIRCSFEGTLKDLFQIYTRERSPRKLFYSKLAMKLSDLELMRTFKVIWVNNKLREDKEYTVSPPKSGIVNDLLEEMRKLVPGVGEGSLRLLEVFSHRIQQEFPKDYPLSKLHIQTSATRQLRAEEVPADEMKTLPNEMVVYVGHFHKETYNSFGVPFTLKIREGEKFSAIRERVQKRLDVPEVEFKSWRFAVINAQKVMWIREEEDFVVRLASFRDPTSIRPYLGLEHVNKHMKRPRIAYSEKSIKIHN